MFEGRLVRVLISVPTIALLLCSITFGSPTQDRSGSEQPYIEQEISFKTEDGWTIYGTLSIPTGLAPGEKVPGVAMVHSPAHDRDIYLGRHQVGQTITGQRKYAQENLRSALGKTATLRIDIRGRGKSATPQEYHTFTPEQRVRIALDVSGAVDFLSRQEQVDPHRIGVVAEGESTEAATVAAFKDYRVVALVLLSGRMGQAAKDLIATRDDLAILCLVSKEDKVAFGDMTDVYKLSRNPESDFLLYRDIGVGNSMFIMWANKFPNEKQLEITVAEWLNPKLRISASEVSFPTEDGWTIYGNLRLPATSGQSRAPGVVFIHSYLTDRHVFDELERTVAAGGFAVLNIDFRGRGKSQGKGSYFNLSEEERDRTYLDIRAALNTLAAHKEVDANRLAIVATSVGVKYGMKAASTDRRVKSFVMLGGLPDRADVAQANFPMLLISSLGLPQIAQAFRDFYNLTKDRGAQLLEHEGGAVGYQIFEIDESLQPQIVRWLKTQFALP